MADQKKRYASVLRTVSEATWAVLPQTLAVVREVLAAHVAGVEIDTEEFAERREQYAVARAKADGLSGSGVAVLPLYGLIIPRAGSMMELSGATSTEAFTAMLRSALADPNVGSIVVDVDSPGGMVAGVEELAAELRAAREQKPVYMVANPLAASAAYWLQAQATEAVVTPSGQVGSIGVLTVHQEISEQEKQQGVKTTLISAGKYKTEGNPFEPLSDSARERIQEQTDKQFDKFVADVALGRGMSERRVRNGFGEGAMELAEDALAERMVNRVATLEQTVERAFRKAGGRGRAAAAIADDQEFWGAEARPRIEFAAGGIVPNPGTAGAQPGEFAVSATATGVHEWGDRRTDPVVTTREREMDPEQQDDERDGAVATVEPRPREVDPARGEMAKAVHELRAAVAEMNEGRADREKVERLTEEMMELRAQLDAVTQARSGYLPGDSGPEQIPFGLDTLAASMDMSVPRAAKALHRDEDQVADFRVKADNLLLLAAAMKADPRQTAYYEKEFLPALAAMDTQTTAEGKEWVPTVMSSDLIRRVELALKVPALFRAVDMPSNPYDMPGVGVARVRGGKAVEQTADTGQTGFKKITPATRKVTLTAVKFAAEVLVSKEEEEDSLIPVIPFLRDEIVSTIAFDIEDATINGDTAGSHQDSDVTAADDPRKNWDGLRKLTQAATKTDGSAAVIDSAKLRVNRKKMAKYGVDSSQIVHLLSIAGYVNLLSDANVLTVDKYGPNAVIKVGELASVDGIPVIVSQFIRDDLNASGVYDSTTTTKTVAITVNTNGFVYGNRRALTLQMLRELYAEYDQDALAVTQRKAFAPIYPVATEKTVALTYNTNN